MSKIGNITPIKNDMNKEEAEIAIKNYLKEILIEDNILKEENLINKEFKICGGKGYYLLTFKGGSQYVHGDEGLSRLIGAKYLEKELNEHEFLNKWSAVETKVIYIGQDEKIKIQIKKADSDPLKNILTIDSNDFTSVSKYVDDKKPEEKIYEGSDGYSLMKDIGFTDFAQGANLRYQADDSTVIIDTEYRSFSSAKAKIFSEQTISELGGLEFSYSISDFGM